MKKLLLFITITFIALIYGCKPNSIIDEPIIEEPIIDEPIDLGNDNVVTITANMPDGIANVDLTWKEGDRLSLLLVDGPKKIIQTVAVNNVRDAGKRADFAVDLSEITGTTFDLYGVYGGSGFLASDPDKAVLPLSTESVASSLTDFQDKNAIMLKFSQTGISKNASYLPSVSLKHIGSLFSIRLNNIGTSVLTDIKKVRIISTSSAPLGVHINSGGGTYNVITGDVTGTSSGTVLDFNLPEAVNVPVDGSLDFWGWYIPNTNVWPEIKIEALNSSNAVLRTFIYPYDAKKQPTTIGKVFYFNAFFPYTQKVIDLAVGLAISLSFPLYGDGQNPHPDAFVDRVGAVGTDRDQASPAYRQARLDAIAIAKAAGNPFLPEDRVRRYAHCSQFTQTVIVNTIDPLFANDTQSQIAYVNDAANGWVKIGPSENYTPSDYKPGDIFLTRVAGHTFMWIGDYGESSEIISQASISGKLPYLCKSGINPTTGLDKYGRAYDIWRFMGRPETGNN